MGADAAARGHEGRVGEDDVGALVPAFVAGEGVVFVDGGAREAVQVEVDAGEAHHVRGDVVAAEAVGDAGAFVGRERARAVRARGGGAHVLPGGDEEARRAAGGVEHALVLLRIEHGHDEVDEVAGRAELPGVALRAHDGEQVLEGVAEALGVVVLEPVDDAQELAQRGGVAVGQGGVVEDVAEEGRQAVVAAHAPDGLLVAVERLVAAEAGMEQHGPAVAREFAREEGALAAQLLRLGVHVVHELVDEGEGDLLDLALGVGHLAHEDVAGGIDAAPGLQVEHGAPPQAAKRSGET